MEETKEAKVLNEAGYFTVSQLNADLEAANQEIKSQMKLGISAKSVDAVTVRAKLEYLEQVKAEYDAVVAHESSLRSNDIALMILLEVGYSSIGLLNADVQVASQELESQMKHGISAKSVAAVTVRAKLEYLEQVKASYNAAMTRAVLPSPKEASTCVSVGAKSSYDCFVYIFHDVENCTCNGYLDARKLVNSTLVEVLAAYYDNREKAISMNLQQQVLWTWNFWYADDK